MAARIAGNCPESLGGFRVAHVGDQRPRAIQRRGAEVIGVSSDSADRHAGFASKHRLPFTLLADQGGRVRKAYGVPAALAFIPGRVTYVIDRTGTVRHIFNSMTNIDGHVTEALEVVRQLQAEQPALPGARYGASSVSTSRRSCGNTLETLPSR